MTTRQALEALSHLKLLYLENIGRDQTYMDIVLLEDVLDNMDSRGDPLCVRQYDLAPLRVAYESCFLTNKAFIGTVHERVACFHLILELLPLGNALN